MYSVVILMALNSTDPGCVGRSVARSSSCSGFQVRQVTRTRTFHARRAGCNGNQARSSSCNGGFNQFQYQNNQGPYPSGPAPQRMPATIQGSACPTCPGGACAVVTATVVEPRRGIILNAIGNALDAVNARRGSLRLHAYIHDPDLEAAAIACVNYRAAHGLHGSHYRDTAFLAPGVQKWGPPDSKGWRQGLVHSGCEGDQSDSRFLTCCIDDKQYTYAGAASAVDSRGRYYHQLFVR